MNLIKYWKTTTKHFDSSNLWSKRLKVLNLSDDLEFEVYLTKLKNSKPNQRDLLFLNKLLEFSEASNLSAFLNQSVSNNVNLGYCLTAQYLILLENFKESHELYFFKKYFQHKIFEKYLVEDLLLVLAPYILPTITYEYYVYLKAYEKIENEESLYEFIELSNTEEWILYFFDSYPVLLSILAEFHESFNKNINTLFLRLFNDLDEIKETFSIPANSEITKIKLFLGDPHKDFQTTILIQFGNTFSIYYKPKSLSNDIFFNLFIEYLQSIGLDNSLHLTKIIDKTNYGWQLGIDYSEIEKEENIPTFFLSQGINLSLAYILNLQDLIADNVIVNSNLPCFFDLEMILLPQWKHGNDYRTRSKAGREFLEGIIKTGLVPANGFETVNNIGYSNSGICKVSDNSYKRLVSVDDKFNLVSFDIKSSDKNLPSFNNKTYKVNKYCENFELGFKTGCDFFIKNKIKIKKFLFKKKDYINKIQSRVLIRLTYSYTGLKNESYYPAYMADRYEYYKLLELLWRGYDEVFVKEEIIQNEIHQMLKNDIPYFFTYPNSKDIFDSNNNIIVKDFFEKSGIDFLKNRLDELNEDTIIQQTNILRRALYIHNDYNKEISYPSIDEINFTRKEVHPSQNIGLFLENLNRSDSSEGYFSYIDFTISKDDLWSQGIQNCDVFQGIEGLGIYFTSLYSTFGNTRYLDHACKIFNQSLEFFQANREGILDSPSNKIGIMNFPISTLYYSYIGNKILKKEIFKINEENFNKILDYIEIKYVKDNSLSYFSGSTGALSILIEIYKSNPLPEIFKLINSLADFIVEKSSKSFKIGIMWEKPVFNKWGGFAHGNSSIAYTLFKVSEITQSNKFYDAGIEALLYDQSLFNSKKRIWNKSEDFEGDIHHSWGNGSAGIGLSRHLISNFYTNDFLLEEIDYAKSNIDENLTQMQFLDHSICSGLLGMLEIRSLIDKKFSCQPYVNDYMKRLTNINDIKCGGWDQNPIITGLYYGYAGIGYNLIKLSKNSELPSLLWL